MCFIVWNRVCIDEKSIKFKFNWYKNRFYCLILKQIMNINKNNTLLWQSKSYLVFKMNDTIYW